MDIQPEEFVGNFQLYPMLIPGWRDSVLPAGVAHGGIPQSIYQEPKGLLMVIDPQTTLSQTPQKTLLQTLEAYDSIVVWLNGKPTSVHAIIQPGEENNRIALYLTPGLLSDGINQLFYRWTRSSENFADSTPILNVLYHDPAPGYPAPAAIVVIHPVSVGPMEAAEGVVMNFRISYLRRYDTVTLTVGAQNFPITVTDSTQPIALTLTAEDFQLIGDNPLTPIKARVVDQLGNGNSSATTFMDIHASQLMLEQPILREILNDNNDDPDFIDLERINGGPLWALVHLIQDVWSVGDSIHLVFTSMLGGSQVAFYESTLPITQVPAQFAWEIPNAKVIADSQVSVIYEQIRQGLTIRRSDPAVATVRGKTSTIISEDLDALPTQVVSVGGAILTQTMTIKFVSGDGRLAVAPTNQPAHPDIPGKREKNVLHIGFETSGRQTVELELLKSTDKVSFWYFWINYELPIDFYNSKGVHLDRKLLIIDPIAEPKYFEYSGVDIKTIILTAPVVDWLGLDFFTFTS
ncbi:hypothetical protein JRG42_19525 [Pseudomonas granadensis]|uniref:hypothetical protein n=1 Tax=Pseudomonas granadensis TaxID=1421430 RepID=UPI0019CF6C8D|nr:hypothetical protein [Pseudomonas granadensis]MBN6772792.1 hypothetical protein [Pseudomonas granadensis]MBN6806268.1 hypothetical protein [Pseudomonas granadensis]MBN6830847.1 hypothetical protein [Pseudomonas granadensis]MBN6840871.1 hypothetical protein [Pseudomonas granadensis]MBN6867751.1 hypothetical protein [Pseudomonas granadensis]